MRILRRSAILLLLSVPPAFSQSPQSSQEARLTGVLTDPSGGGVGSVQVTATLEDKSDGLIYRATSRSDGEYVLVLPAGRYLVRFARTPFVQHHFELSFSPGETRRLDLRLELEELSSSVVVTAQAEPLPSVDASAPVTLYTRQDIEKRQAVGMADLLLFAPSVSMGRTGPEGGQTSIFLAGGNSSFTKVLVDGTPANEPGNAVDFSNFTLDNIEKVEIVRGAESALYGTDAVVGVIQVFSHRGTTRTPAVRLFAEGGGFSTGRGGAQLSGLAGKFDYSAAASYLQTDGQGPNNRFVNRTLAGNFGWSFSDANQLRFSLRNNTSNAGIPGQTLFEPPNRDQHADLHFFSSSVRWSLASGPHWHHELGGAESYAREFNANPAQSFFSTNPAFGCPQTDPAAVATAAFCDFTYVNTNKYNRAGFTALSSYLLPKIGVTAGYQYEVENAFLSFLNAQHLRRNNQGGFLDARWSPHPRVTANAGLRAEANEVFGTRVVPRVGASLLVRPGQGLWGDTRVRVFYGQGIKEPRFDQSFGADPCFPGNPSLRPERSRTWNAGIEQKLASDSVKISAEYFQNRFYDIVSFTFCVPGGPCPVTPPAGCPFGFGTFFNTDLARARGVNVTLEARPVGWLTVLGSYTHNNSRVLISPNAFDPALIPGNRLIRRPVNSGSLLINAAYRRANFNFAGYFSGARTDSDFLGLGLTRNPGYARFDLATNYDFGRGVSLYGRVTNLFDKQYQDALGYPALGRDFRLGMNYRFGGKQ